MTGRQGHGLPFASFWLKKHSKERSGKIRSGSVKAVFTPFCPMLRTASSVFFGAVSAYAKAPDVVPKIGKKVGSKRMSRGFVFLFHSRCRCPDRLAEPKDGLKNETLQGSRPATGFNV